MPPTIDTCFEAFADLQQVDLLPPQCRDVVLVYSAWGIIENGGFEYFFEADFPGNPAFEVFTNAFRGVGLEEIASDFSDLVALFPFSEPHKHVQKREEFLSSESASFMDAMKKLERRIAQHDNIEATLNTFLRFPQSN
jgi:hypothetical protein